MEKGESRSDQISVVKSSKSGALTNLLPKSELAQAIIWEAYLRARRSEGGEKGNYLNPNQIREKYACAYNAAWHAFTKTDWITDWLRFERTRSGGKGWVLRRERKKILDEWATSYIREASSFFRHPEILTLSFWILSEIQNEKKSIYDIRMAIENSDIKGLLKKDVRVGCLDRVLMRMIEFVLLFFSPWVEVEYRGKEGRTFYYGLKESPRLILASDKWAFKRKKLDGSGEEELGNYMVNLQDLSIIAPTIASEQPRAILKHRREEAEGGFYRALAGKVVPNAPLNFPWVLINIREDQEPREAFPARCEECKEIQSIEGKVFENVSISVGKRVIADVHGPPQEVKSPPRFESCVENVNRLIKPWLRGKRIRVFYGCPKGLTFARTKMNLFIPTMFR